MSVLGGVAGDSSDGFSGSGEEAVGDDKTMLDGSGFFVIHVDGRSKRIVVEHYSYDRRVKAKFFGRTSKALCDTLVRRGIVADASHAAYLGRELMKAELALRENAEYVQDRSLKL